MARALVVLACAAAAAATHYAEYAGGKMPQYGGDYEAVGEPAQHSDDYHGHSQDASASLDYKYQEERHSKTDKPSKIVDDSDVWPKVRRKQRGLQRPAEHGDMDSAGFNDDDDEAPRTRADPGPGHAKRRPRLKSADDVRHPSHRRSAKYSRDRKIEVSYTSDIDRDDISDDKSTEFEDDRSIARYTTRRVNRRKPRDKSTNFDDDLNIDEELLVADRRMKGDEEKESDYSAAETGRRRPPDWPGPRDRYRPVLGDNDDGKMRPGKQKQKIYDDYNDYYDMKRVQSIKEKLPALLRRSSTVKAPTKTPSETELMNKLWANRRLGAQSIAASPPNGSDILSDTSEPVDVVPSNIPTENSSAAAKLPTATVLTNDTGTIETSATAVAPANLSLEPSLAEKSRLSILKKALRKDGVKEELTKKPAVLLQVTQKLATVVMVEPPASRQPGLPAHILTGDSPERIERVKKLMRHKLVAQAKNIQDLTDHWDEMVCDYIDVALIDAASGAPAPPGLDLVATNLLLFISINVLMH